MLRLAIALALIAACGGSSRGPAWPKSADHETDGGESLAPKPGSVAVNASSDDDDEVVATPAEKPAAKAPADETKPDSPRPTAPTVTAPDDVINTDDLIIEIDD